MKREGSGRQVLRHEPAEQERPWSDSILANFVNFPDGSATAGISAKPKERNSQPNNFGNSAIARLGGIEAMDTFCAIKRANRR